MKILRAVRGKILSPVSHNTLNRGYKFWDVLLFLTCKRMKNKWQYEAAAWILPCISGKNLSKI